MKKKIALLLSVAMVASLCLVGCGSSKKSGTDSKVYAVEAGAAGEQAALDKMWNSLAVENKCSFITGRCFNGS